MDRLPQILLVAGIGFFLLAFVLSGLYPWLITDAQRPMATLDSLAEDVSSDFRELKRAYPVVFAASYPDGRDALLDRDIPAAIASELERRRAGGQDPADLVPEKVEAEVRAKSTRAWQKSFARALRDGRDIYVAEACWHCHSQFVRPVANEEVRFGAVREPKHDNNFLQRPQLWGTRRVGPDLTHEGGKRSNDWHMAHLRDPRSTSPDSVMPRYPWFFQDGWQIRRTIDSEAAERSGLPTDMSYAYPGLHETEARATAAMEALKEALPSNLAAEKEAMFVARARGPAASALSLVTYLQWLGTWDPDQRKGSQ